MKKIEVVLYSIVAAFEDINDMVVEQFGLIAILTYVCGVMLAAILYGMLLSILF